MGAVRGGVFEGRCGPPNRKSPHSLQSHTPALTAEFLGEAVESIGSYIADMQKTRSVIFFNGVGLALVAGFAWLAFLRKFVRVIVWGTIVSYLGMVSLFHAVPLPDSRMSYLSTEHGQ